MAEGDASEAGKTQLRDAASEELSEDERSQIAARLRLNPADRLQYLLDMLAFEELAKRARRID
jgi:hypothetical protein